VDNHSSLTLNPLSAIIHLMSTTTLIFGATSAMAEHTARLLAADGEKLILAARDPQRLEPIADDLRVRGAVEVRILQSFDASQPETFQALIDEAGEFNQVLIAHGQLPDQEGIENDPGLIQEQLQINQNSTIDLCTRLAEKLEGHENPTLAVISSVAGLRGRQSNYIYGTAKGAVNIFLQGLRNRLQPAGIRVITILPGFVDSPMTADIDKGPLFISAEKAGACIHKALTKGKLDIVYVPFFWRYIMWVILVIPETIFKRLKL